MTDRDLALAYAPILHFDRNETIPLRAVGYTVFREEAQSDSFPRRRICVPAGVDFVIEYAFYWDYDIGHHEVKQMTKLFYPANPAGALPSTSRKS